MNFMSAAVVTVPQWVSDSFKYIRIVLISLMIVLALLIIVIILLQPAKQEGLGAISGGTDTFFSKNKGRTREGMLLRLTIVIAVTILVLALIYFVTLIFDQSVIEKAAEETAKLLAR